MSQKKMVVNQPEVEKGLAFMLDGEIFLHSPSHFLQKKIGEHDMCPPILLR
jgi:hypothetical protein